MSRTVLMTEIDLRGIPAPLVKFLDDNRVVKIHEPSTDGTRTSRTAYFNPLATTPGRGPAFTLQITDFTSGDQQSIMLSVDEALQVNAICAQPEAFSVCVDIIAEARAQGRTVRRTKLSPEKLRHGG